MTPEQYEAIRAAEKIAATAYPITEVTEGRWLFGFDDVSHLYVVADASVKALGLAILIIEQMAIIKATEAGAKASAAVQAFRLQDIPPATETKQ
jgi:hypothetical protein